jgi:hypothetical protein
MLIEFQNQHLSEEDPQPDLLKTQPGYLCLKLILVHYAPNQLSTTDLLALVSPLIAHHLTQAGRGAESGGAGGEAGSQVLEYIW